MSTICLIKQRDYVGGGDVTCFKTKSKPALDDLFADNFEGIQSIYDNEELRNKYGVEVIMTEEDKIDRFGDNDYMQHYVINKGKRIKIAKTSYNNIDSLPFVDVDSKVDIAIICCSKNTTKLVVKREGAKVFLISDDTRGGAEFINRFLIDFNQKCIYLYEDESSYDTRYKDFGFYKTKIIGIEKTM